MSQLALLDLELDRGQLTEATEAMWGEPSPGVQWSFSAHSALRRCQLQYFFGYKLANAKSLDPERREAWILGQLQDLARWRGRLVDHGMEHILVPSLKAGRIPTLDELVQPTLAVARRQWDFSAGGHYRQPGLRKGPCQDDFCALYEHEYGMIVGETDRARVESEVVDAFRNLLQLSDLLDHLRQQRTFQAQRTLWILFERARVRAIPDLLCWGGRQCTIVDWKATASESSDYRWQMLVYALAVRHTWSAQADNILVYEVRLLDGIVVSHAVTESRLTAAEDLLYESVLEMDALTGGKSLDAQNPEDYEPARSSRTCATCNFRKICLRGRETVVEHCEPL